MTTRIAGDYIEDILNAMLDIQEFMAEYSYDRFVNDRKTQYAVIRAIERVEVDGITPTTKVIGILP